MLAAKSLSLLRKGLSAHKALAQTFLANKKDEGLPELPSPSSGVSCAYPAPDTLSFPKGTEAAMGQRDPLHQH